jgi:hypothetical protein
MEILDSKLEASAKKPESKEDHEYQDELVEKTCNKYISGIKSSSSKEVFVDATSSYKGSRP